MGPIEFECGQRFRVSAGDVCSAIADLARWTDFEGYGPLPGIRSAQYVTRTPDMVGSVIRVSNKDGSSHSERILEWVEGAKVVLQLGEFSRPLSLFADRFVET